MRGNVILHMIKERYKPRLPDPASAYSLSPLRLDNTGAWVIEVFPSLLCNQMSEHVDLYVKLKLGIFSFI